MTVRRARSGPRRTSVRLAGPISSYDNGSGQVAQLVLSMPFPNDGEMHVGDDLTPARQSSVVVLAALMPAKPLAGVPRSNDATL